MWEIKREAVQKIEKILGTKINTPASIKNRKVSILLVGLTGFEPVTSTM